MKWGSTLLYSHSNFKYQSKAVRYFAEAAENVLENLVGVC